MFLKDAALLSTAPGLFSLDVHTLRAKNTAFPRGRERNLLAHQCPPDAVKDALLPLEQYHPFPRIADRAAWDALRPETRQAILAEGERMADFRYQPMPATLMLQYPRTGNRSNFEQLRNANLAALQAQTQAECLENKGRYLDAIANGLWAICEESFWGVPAHLYIQKKGLGLPDPADPIVDLFAAQTAAAVATTVYLLGDRLDTVSPILRQRVGFEAERRIFNPLLTQNFMWMGLPGAKRRDDLPWDATPAGEVQPVNNWDAWICWNWLTTVLFLDTNATRRTAGVLKIQRCLDQFINTYPDDGGCEEGCSYWNVAAGAMSDGLELFESATAGRVMIWRDPLLKRMGEYIVDAHIAGGLYLNIGDAHSNVALDSDKVFRYGKHVGSVPMIALAQASMGPEYRPRTLPALFSEQKLRAEPPHAESYPANVWLPETALMAVRMQAGSTRGLYTACIASDNGKSHSHNDTGSIWLYLDGEPVLIDLGQEAYQKQSFDAHRYELFSTQSAFHNLPTFGTTEQGVGSAFRATDLIHRDGSTSSLSFNLAEAYPPEARLGSLMRRLSLDRAANAVELSDSFQLKGAPQPVTWTLMTCRPTEITANGLRFTPRPQDHSAAVTAVYDTASVQTRIEPIALTNAGLVDAWGKLVYRIQISMPPRTAGQLMLRFRPA